MTLMVRPFVLFVQGDFSASVTPHGRRKIVYHVLSVPRLMFLAQVIYFLANPALLVFIPKKWAPSNVSHAKRATLCHSQVVTLHRSVQDVPRALSSPHKVPARVHFVVQAVLIPWKVAFPVMPVSAVLRVPFPY